MDDEFKPLTQREQALVSECGAVIERLQDALAAEENVREHVRLTALNEFERVRKGEPVGDPYVRVARILATIPRPESRQAMDEQPTITVAEVERKESRIQELEGLLRESQDDSLRLREKLAAEHEALVQMREKCREAFRQLRDDVSFMDLPRTVNQTRHAVLRAIELAMWHEGWDDEGALDKDHDASDR